MARRFLLLRFEVTDPAISDGDVEELAERMVAEQIDPDPPVLTWDGSEIRRA